MPIKKRKRSKMIIPLKNCGVGKTITFVPTIDYNELTNRDNTTKLRQFYARLSIIKRTISSEIFFYVSSGFPFASAISSNLNVIEVAIRIYLSSGNKVILDGIKIKCAETEKLLTEFYKANPIINPIQSKKLK